MSDEELSPAALHDIWRKGWYNVAMAIANTGHDVVVHDPDAEAVEVLYHHAAITVVPTVALGWSIYVHECEPDCPEDEG